MEDRDRRKLLMAGLGAASVALAGCTSSSPNEDAKENASEAAGKPTPSPPSSAYDDELQQFVVESLEYQNEMLHSMAIVMENHAAGQVKEGDP